jgi:hypothetical protein
VDGEKHRDVDVSVTTMVAFVNRMVTDAVDHPGGPPRPSVWRGRIRSRDLARSWRTALEVQVQATGQSPADAQIAVELLVNHMCHLARRAPWFNEPGLRRAAVEEGVLYTLYAAPVASREAHEAWQHTATWHRSVEKALAFDPTAVPSVDAGRTELMGIWRQWADQRGQAS